MGSLGAVPMVKTHREMHLKAADHHQEQGWGPMELLGTGETL